MKNNILQKAVSLAFFLSICFMTNYLKAIENSHKTNDNYLTVHQSLIPMFGKVFSSKVYNDKEFPFNRINPKVREYIRFYIQEDNIEREISSAGIWLLGFVGNEDDISFIEQYIDKILESSMNPDNRMNISNGLAANVGWFAGMITKREIKGATKFLKKYANVSSWMIASEDDTLENLYTARKLYSYFIMCAYQYSKSPYLATLLQEKSPDSKPYLHESFVDSYLAIEVDKYTELMKPVSISDKKLNANMAKCLEQYGERIDMLLRKQTYAQWREAQKKQKTVPKVEKRPVDSFESIDMSKTIEGAYLKVVVSEAVKAYMQVSRMLLGRDATDLPVKKEVLQDIQKAGLNNYDNFQITVDVEAKINDFVPTVKSSDGKDEGSTAGPVVLKDKVTAAVTFNIQGTADIFERHVPDAGDNSLISSTTGDVIIKMKRIDGKWYWSPASDLNVSAEADIVEDNYLIDSVSEAIIAYTQISRMIIDGNYDPLVIPVLDDGKLIPLKKRKKDKDEMAEALDLEKRVLEDLTKAKLNNYGDYLVKVTFEATLGNGGISIETGAMPLTVKGYETADVTFMIRDGTEVFKKHAPARSDYDGAEGSGDLQVYMKRINGKWYWNPFGW